MSFDDFCTRHHVTSDERAALVLYLAVLRAVRTAAALQEQEARDG